MNLKELGWNKHFREHFEKYKDSDLVPARVIREDKYTYSVMCKKGELMAEITGKFRYETELNTDFPKTGDWVVLTPRYNEGTASIHALLPRINCISRKEAGSKTSIKGGKTEEQIIAANIDTAFIICGLDWDYSLRRIERFIMLARKSETFPVIILNKADICKKVEDRVVEVKTIAGDAPVYAISATEKQGIRSLYKYFKTGKTIVLLGSSGVGKSTLINSILKDDRQEVKELSKYSNKGLHTTSTREMIFIPDKGLIIDNPGMREVGMWADEETLSDSFDDIEELASQCHYRDCQHESEPKCAIKQALEDGTLDPDRYQNYLKLQKEIEFLEKQQQEKERRAEKTMQKKTRKKRKWK